MQSELGWLLVAIIIPLIVVISIELIEFAINSRRMKKEEEKDGGSTR